MANLLGVKRVGGGGGVNYKFEALFDSHPSSDEVAEAQEKAGFHPAGYGGPFNVHETSTPEGNKKVTFECWHTCD